MSNTYKDKFKLLLEYNVKKGINLQDKISTLDEVIPVLKEDDPIPNEINTEKEEVVESEPKGNNKLEKQVDILSKLAKSYNEKIDTIFDFIDNINNQVNAINTKTNELDFIKTEIQDLDQRVEKLTPPTPLETLNKMTKISGAISLQDYWNDYLIKNGRKPINQPIPYYQNGVVDNQETKTLPNYSEDDIKKSLFGEK